MILQIDQEMQAKIEKQQSLELKMMGLELTEDTLKKKMLARQ